MAGGWRLGGHLQGGAGGHAVSTCKTPDGDWELREPAQGGWQLAAGRVGNTKNRDVPTLEARAGTLGVGCTAWDAAGLSSTNRNRVRVARTPVENDLRSLCSETEAEFQPLLL